MKIVVESMMQNIDGSVSVSLTLTDLLRSDVGPVAEAINKAVYESVQKALEPRIFELIAKIDLQAMANVAAIAAAKQIGKDVTK